MADILNANIQAPVTVNLWTTLGPEFGKDARETAVIVRVLYGLKSAGAAFKSHLAKYMSLVRLTNIHGQSQKSDQKMGYSITFTCCVMWMTFFVSITMQMLYFNGYTIAIQTCN